MSEEKKWPQPDWDYGELPDWQMIVHGPPKPPVTSMDLLTVSENIAIQDCRRPGDMPTRYDVSQALLTLRKAGLLTTAVSECVVSRYAFHHLGPHREHAVNHIWQDMLFCLMGELKKNNLLMVEQDPFDNARREQKWRLKLHVARAKP